MFVEWKPADDGEEAKSTSENEWAVIDTVAYNKNDKSQGTLDVATSIFVLSLLLLKC